MNISTNVASMQAHSAYANQNANNIANVNSNGFVPSNTNITEQNGSPRASFSKADNSGSVRSQTDLTKEITNQVLITNGFDANANAIKTQNQMLGTVLDMQA